MQSLLPIAAFGERAQLSRRTIERKIAKGEIAAHYVRRRGIDKDAALATVAPDLSRHDATRKAVKPPKSHSALISVLHDSLSRERARADRAEARAELRSRSGASCSTSSAKPAKALSCCNAS